MSIFQNENSFLSLDEYKQDGEYLYKQDKEIYQKIDTAQNIIKKNCLNIQQGNELKKAMILIVNNLFSIEEKGNISSEMYGKRSVSYKEKKNKYAVYHESIDETIFLIIEKFGIKRKTGFFRC